MRLFSRGTDIEVEDLRVGRIRVRVRENFIDRVVRVFSPGGANKRLAARALALQGGESSASTPGPGRYVISRGIPIPRKEDIGHGARYEHL